MSRKYDRDFKEYIAKLVVDENLKQSELSREHDVPSSTIGAGFKIIDWKKRGKMVTFSL